MRSTRQTSTGSAFASALAPIPTPNLLGISRARTVHAPTRVTGPHAFTAFPSATDAPKPGGAGGGGASSSGLFEDEGSSIPVVFFFRLFGSDETRASRRSGNTPAANAPSVVPCTKNRLVFLSVIQPSLSRDRRSCTVILSMSSRADFSVMAPAPRPWHTRRVASFQKSIGFRWNPSRSTYAPRSLIFSRASNSAIANDSNISPSCSLSCPNTERFRSYPAPNISARSGCSWLRSLPRVLHFGVVSLK